MSWHAPPPTHKCAAGYNPYVVAARIHELEEETKQLRMQVSPIYSEIILKHSSYEKPQQDRLFFEALYQTLILLLDEAFARLQKRAEIEQEIGNMFRSKHFNLYKRKNQPPRCGAACGSVAGFEQTLG